MVSCDAPKLRYVMVLAHETGLRTTLSGETPHKGVLPICWRVQKLRRPFNCLSPRKKAPRKWTKTPTLVCQFGAVFCRGPWLRYSAIPPSEKFPLFVPLTPLYNGWHVLLSYTMSASEQEFLWIYMCSGTCDAHSWRRREYDPSKRQIKVSSYCHAVAKEKRISSY